jgi:spermidine synthase
MDERDRVVWAAFFASGAAGVVHEVVWARLLVRIMGAAAHAEVVVLAAFMGGLALGGALLGRRADRVARPLLLYVGLEVAVAAYALLLPWLTEAAGAGYLALARRLFDHGGARLALRMALAALVVTPPAALLGGTLPVLVRWSAGHRDAGRSVGAFYAINAAGAVLGTVLAGFVLLPAVGVRWSVVAAAGLNLAAAAVVVAGRRAGNRIQETGNQPRATGNELGCPSPVTHCPSPASCFRRFADAAVIPIAVVTAGATAMGYEALFIRIVGLAFGSSTHAFTMMLAAFIAGIALGSGVAARWRGEARWTVGLARLGLVVAFLAATPAMARLAFWIDLLRGRLRGVPGGFELLHLGAGALVMAVLLVPTACMGCTFPLLAGMRARRPGRVGAVVGATYAWSTIGNVAGIAITTLALLPRLGLGRAFAALLLVDVAAGALLLGTTPHRRRLLVLAGAAALALAVLAVGTRWTATLDLVPDHLRAGPAERTFAAWKRRYLLPEQRSGLERYRLEEDAHNTVTAYGPDRRTGSVDLAVNNKVDASTGAVRGSDLEVQLLTGHAPMLLAPGARTLLVIGHGSGITAGAALRHPVLHADVVEISPAVLAVDPLFAAANHHVLSDDRVEVHVEDAQGFVRAVPRRYDVIISEPSNPWMAGVADLFTVDFLRAARARLNPGGVFAFWFHTYGQSDATVKMLLRTLGTVFPHALLFFDLAFANVIAVASSGALAVDFAAIEARYAQGAVRLDLRRLGIPNLVALLAHHGLVQEGATGLVGPGPVNTFDHQVVQYAAARTLFAGESSYLCERLDGFLTGFDPASLEAPTESAVLVDRYIAFRRTAGRPVSPDELEQAARYAEAGGGYGPRIARALRARAEALPPS